MGRVATLLNYWPHSSRNFAKKKKKPNKTNPPPRKLHKTQKHTQKPEMNIIRVQSELNKTSRITWKVALYKKHLITLEINSAIY